jgi:DNA phosphorothioation-dependent restriction protein DptG
VKPEVKQSVVANVAAEVVDRFLARRADGGRQGGYS